MGVLTERQVEVYNFILDYTVKHLYPPSYEEISENTKVCGKSEASRICRVLERKGYLTIKPYVPRGITLKGYKLVKDTPDEK